MLDDVTATLAMSTLAEGEHCATLSLSTSFLRPAKPGRLIGRATLVRRGRAIMPTEREHLRLALRMRSHETVTGRFPPLDATPKVVNNCRLKGGRFPVGAFQGVLT